MDGIRMERNKTAMLTIVEEAEASAALPAPLGAGAGGSAAAVSPGGEVVGPGGMSDIETT